MRRRSGLSVEEAIRIAEAITTAHAESTRTRYDWACSQWERWCQARGAITLPAETCLDLRLPHRMRRQRTLGRQHGPRQRRDRLPTLTCSFLGGPGVGGIEAFERSWAVVRFRRGAEVADAKLVHDLLDERRTLIAHELLSAPELVAAGAPVDRG